MTGAGGPCTSCGGSLAHHQNDRACWCPRCLAGPDADRCTTYTAPKAKPPKPDIDREVVRVGATHPETSVKAAAKAKPKSGTLRRMVYDQIARSGALGATDDEIERALNRSHQSVSGARNTLSGDDLIRDSGLRRKTRYRNDAIAWVVTDIADQIEAQGAAPPTLDLSSGPVVRSADGRATVNDGPVEIVIPADESLPVLFEVDGVSLGVFPPHRLSLWETITSEFSSPEDVQAACEHIYQSVHALSVALKEVGR